MQSESASGYRPRTIFFSLILPLAVVLSIHGRLDLIQPLGFDETVVSGTARQPDLAALWKILVSGQSPHPPLNFLAVRAAYALFGVSELATRLPTTLGFTVRGICLFFFVAKRSNAAFGTVAMLFPLLTMARVYAVEAKPYGSLMGWTGLALICWQYAKPGYRSRRWALAGLGTALACATGSHFFGVVAGFPILAGEAIRCRERRRVDWLLAGALSLNYWPLVFFLPILKAGGAVHGVHPWQRPLNLGFIPRSFDLLLAEAAAPIFVCILIAAAFRFWKPATDTVRMPADELAAAGALALLPVVAFCGLRPLGIKVIEEKYLIAMVVGVAILFAWSLCIIAGRSLALGSVLAGIVLFWGCRDFVRDLRVAEDDRSELERFTPPASTDALGPLPIVVDSPRFATIERYAAPAIADRIYYVIDPEARLRYAAPMRWIEASF